MSPLLKTALTVLAAVAIVAALINGSALLESNEESAPVATPKPGVTTQATQFRTVPDVSQARRRLVAKDIAKMLDVFYSTGFIQPAATPSPDQSPRPRPTRRIASLMTRQARAALAEDSGAFDQAEDLAVYTGTVRFGGLLTFEGRQALEAFLDVDFGGIATPVGRSSPQVKVRQTGTMVLKNTEDGWRIDGFNLKFASRPVPTPEPPGP